MGIQFAVSLIAIIFIIYSKPFRTHLTTYDYGIKTDNLVYVYLQDVNYEIFRNEIITNSSITGVSSSNEVPVYGGQTALNLRNENMEEPMSAFYYSVDPEFINHFNIELIAGRNFSDEYSTDAENAIIINEEAVRIFNLDLPVESIGKTLIIGDNLEVMVIGVVKDFLFYFPDEPVYPLVLLYMPEEFRFATISYVPGTKDEVETYLQATWEKLDKVHSVRYQFFDDARQEFDSQLAGFIGIFSGIVGFIVLIALLGLFGMSIYSTEMRIKEIGIRKVIGASVTELVYLLSKDYLKLILYSAMFAIPVAYILSSVFYQFLVFDPPGLSLWALPAALIFILILALITISSQTVRAALANPAETLKEE